MRKRGSIRAWCELFRLPNLPSAPGDALAGAAVASVAVCARPTARELLAVALCALFLYMAGLAQNDWADADEDRRIAPDRPIPSGRMTRAAAGVAVILCAGVSLLTAFIFGLPSHWYVMAGFLFLLMTAYNFLKGRFPRFGLVAMGLCRGVSLLCGAVAMGGMAGFRAALPLAVGWTAYIASVTLLGAQEERAAAGLPWVRFLPALIPWIPMSVFFWIPSTDPIRMSCAVLGTVATAGVWTMAVAPLGRPHTPEQRRAAVGAAIGALLYWQTGFALLAEGMTAGLLMALALFSRRMIRRCLPTITGS